MQFRLCLSSRAAAAAAVSEVGRSVHDGIGFTTAFAHVSFGFISHILNAVGWHGLFILIISMLKLIT